MQVFRTPDSAFSSLPGFEFEPHYLTIDGGRYGPLRVHYLDEGPAGAPVALLLHGEPSWSYLYRRMVAPLVAAGFRCVVPDLVGFGRSDKLLARDAYSYDSHLNWLTQTLDGLKLRHLHLFCQDWGGLLGLRIVAADPDRFASVCAANTALPTGTGDMPQAFMQWREFSQSVEMFPTSKIIQSGCVRPLDPAVAAAYDAPFPDEPSKAGARAFPPLVPITPDMPGAQENQSAWQQLRQLERPFLTLFGDSDPVTAGAEQYFQSQIPGSADQPHAIIANAGHFIQEDAAEALLDHWIPWLKALPDRHG